MRKFLMAAVALSLLSGAAAHAQPQQDDHHDHGGQGGGQGHGGGQPQGQGAGRSQPLGQPRGQAAPQGGAHNVPQNFQPRFAPNPGQGQVQSPRGGYFQGRTGPNGGQQGAPQGQAQPQGRFQGGPQGQQGGPQGGPRGGQQFDHNGGGYRNGGQGAQGHEWRSPQRYRGRQYFYPRGFGFRTWGFGDYLPGPYFTSDYVIGDYWDYGLQAPPPGFEWMQVGNDALLVRPSDGYVLDVAHDLFD